MAVKKATTKTSSASASKKAPTKKAVTSKAATSKAPAVKAATASKAGTPKAKAKATATATKKPAAKKTPSVKLTDRQLDLLKTVHGTREQGYPADKKAETKTLDALAGKKLIKRGAKDKSSGLVRYHVSKAGEKHVSST